ncbi:MAG: V-type ATPase 116kDa subunit family protein [Erysipelotrichaceae bacterium]
MAICKMKLLEISSQEDHFEEILHNIMNIDYFHGELAANVVTEEGSLLPNDNRYSEMLTILENLDHSFHFEKETYHGQQFSYDKVKAEIDAIEKDFESIESQINQYQHFTKDDMVAVERLREYDFTTINNLKYLTLYYGRIPISSGKKLETFEIDNMIYDVLNTNKQYYWLFVITSNSEKDAVHKLLESLYFEEISIPKVDEKKIINAHQKELADIYGYVDYRHKTCELYKYVAQYDDRYVVTGFVPEEKTKDIIELFANNQDIQVKMQKVDGTTNIVPPTKLKNRWFAKPFEMFVDMYGTPHYFDFDPTTFVGVTYCLLFGMMFGDLGQGACFVLLGWYFAKKKKSKLGAIAMRIGMFSMAFGLLYGSFFGNEEILIPFYTDILGLPSKPIHIMDPELVMPLLIFACGLGALLIVISITVNICLNIRRKEFATALFSSNGLAGLIMYGGILVLVILTMGFNIDVLQPYYYLPITIIPLVLMLFEKPIDNWIKKKPIKPKGGWMGFFVEGIFELFEIVLSFVTNTMSYLRVGGFILSHAGMMLVVMKLKEMSGDFGIIAFIVGNIFVMGLEGMIVGIQTLRLEYYEMFSRYFKSGGKRFVTVKDQK